jgi:hypothetical protein
VNAVNPRDIPEDASNPEVLNSRVCGFLEVLNGYGIDVGRCSRTNRKSRQAQIHGGQCPEEFRFHLEVGRTLPCIVQCEKTKNTSILDTEATLVVLTYLVRMSQY